MTSVSELNCRLLLAFRATSTRLKQMHARVGAWIKNLKKKKKKQKSQNSKGINKRHQTEMTPISKELTSVLKVTGR